MHITLTNEDDCSVELKLRNGETYKVCNIRHFIVQRFKPINEDTEINRLKYRNKKLEEDISCLRELLKSSCDDSYVEELKLANKNLEEQVNHLRKLNDYLFETIKVKKLCQKD